MESSSAAMGLNSLVIILLFILSREISGFVLEGNVEVMSRTLPAFALAEYAEILNGSACQKDLIVFREAINNRKLWSLKS